MTTSRSTYQTQEQVAKAFSATHPDWRYTHMLGEWHYYDPALGVWLVDDALKIHTLLRQLISGQADARMHKSADVAGALSLARSNEGISMKLEDWDSDPFLIGTPGAVIDLRSGNPVADPKRRYITKQTTVRVAPCGTRMPQWMKFLQRITRGTPELLEYLQRIAGYALTGSTREQSLFFAYGAGGNGKSLFFNTLAAIMGSYAHMANNDLFLATNGSRHPTDLAALRGARLVMGSELPAGARWDDQRIKGLTGGDPITARRMRQDYFTFIPQATIVVFGNHRPSFSDVGEAIRRRVRLIPFTEAIGDNERDTHLFEKLIPEYPAILRWALEGCIAWIRDGLATPEAVLDASAAYIEAEDVVGQWIAENLTSRAHHERQFTPRKVLYADWDGWRIANGAMPRKANDLYEALEQRGFTPTKRDGTRGFLHVSLRHTSMESAMN